MPFFLSVELTKPCGYIVLRRERFTFTYVHFVFRFFFYCQGQLPGEAVIVQYFSVYSHIVTEKRCLLAPVDRNIFLGIITALVNMFWTITAWQSGTSLHIKGSFLINIYWPLWLISSSLKRLLLFPDLWFIRKHICLVRFVCLFCVCSPWIWIQICSRLFLGSSYMPQNSLHSCKSCSVLQPPPHLPPDNSSPCSHLTPGALF